MPNQQPDSVIPSTSEIRQTLRLSSLEGSLTSVFLTISAGAFVAGYALYIGCSPFQIGLVGALPYLGQLGHLFGVYLVDRVGKFRILTILTSIISRWTWATLVILPFISSIDQSTKIRIFLWILFISGFAGNAAGNIWTAWMGRIVPGRIRGRYFGLRNSYINIANMATYFIGGVILDLFEFRNPAIGFAIVFGAGIISATVGISLFPRHLNIPSGKTHQPYFWKRIVRPLRSPMFRKLMFFYFQFFFSVGIVGPFFSVYMIKNLHLGFTEIAIYNGIVMGMNILIFRTWGHLVDRFGVRNVLLFTATVITFIPLIWFFARPRFPYTVFFEAIATGLAWSGFNLSIFTIPIEMSEHENRAQSVALFTIAGGLGFVIASTLGGVIAEYLKDFSVTILGVVFINIHVLLVLSFLGRLQSTFILFRVPDMKPKHFVPIANSLGIGILQMLGPLGDLFLSFRQSNEDSNDDGSDDDSRPDQG